MIRGVISLYRPRFARAIVYMLQASEYQAGPYLRWLWRTTNFSRVMYRKNLVRTRNARLLLLVLRAGMLLEVAVAIGWGYWGWKNHAVSFPEVPLALFLLTPIVWSHLIVIPLLLGRWFIIKPYYWWLIRRSRRIFTSHPGAKIAVAGSYGKTTAKEILATVLSQGKKVAATPANKNVAISHAFFARKLKGDEDILIIEYGEGGPGDVARFARVTRPTMGVITGLAPAHLDKYKTLERAGEDIFSLAGYLKGKDVYVNGDSPEVQPFIKDNYQVYDSQEVLGWKVSKIKLAADGLAFKMKKGKDNLELKSHLLGRHLVGTLALAAALAWDFGLSKEQIEKGVAAVMPFEHRMQSYRLHGAWIIDDTYNGNIEGMLAGLKLLEELPASRKIYVTPGLVDQGDETEPVHRRLGQAIAESAPDLVVLMRNSTTEYIREGLRSKNYEGELQIEDKPLEFYTNLGHFVAAGDLVLMQNDWPDQYK